MIKDIPIVNITIYRLDIYRLLTLLLADKQIAENPVFQNLGNDNFDNEVNRLLILVSAVTRQLLDNASNQLEHKLLDNASNQLEHRKCGNFWHNYPTEKTTHELKFKQACSMIIHATEITIRPPEYFYSEDGKEVNASKQEQELYFQGKITIIGQKHERADIDLQQFAQYCIELSDKIIEGG